MAGHGVNDFLVFTVLAQQIDAELEMATLHLPVDRLADVVQQPGALGDMDVDFQLCRHGSGEIGHLLRMFEHVLAVGSAKA